MIDNEKYQKELIRMWDSIRSDDCKGKSNCDGVDCKKCPFDLFCHNAGEDIYNLFEIIETVEMWSKENPPKKYKVSKLEYDIMRATIKYSSNDDSFYDVDILFDLIQKGYFKGACGNMFIHYYFDRCEVADNDG